MRIDAHQHFWKYDSVRDSWIDESMQVIRRDFLPEDLEPVLKQNNVDGCIAVQADQSEEETVFLLDLASKNPFVKGVVGWVDLCSDDIQQRLEYFSENNLFKGVRHIVQGEKDDFVLGEKFQNGIGKLAQYDLVYDILIFPKQLQSAIELVKKFPKQKFVLDHIAKPSVSDEIDETWVNGIEELAKYSNVSCKVSGIVTEAKKFIWEEKQLKVFLDCVFSSFGVDRILYGSDWPVCLLAAEYKEVLAIVENYIKDYSEEDQAKILGGNAISIYNLLLKNGFTIKK
jgi:L-fuconolactonase